MKLLITMGVSVISLIALAAPQAALSKGLTEDAVNGATFSHQALKKADRTPIMVKLQVLLDRAQFSPGLIDGRRGSNVSQALAAYEAAHGLKADGQLDDKVWQTLIEADTEPVLEDYTITEEDVEGPFVKEIPNDLEAMAKLDKLAYSSPAELLAERFHIGEDLLEGIEPGRRPDQGWNQDRGAEACEGSKERESCQDRSRQERKGCSRLRQGWQARRLLSCNDRQQGKPRARRHIQGAVPSPKIPPTTMIPTISVSKVWKRRRPSKSRQVPTIRSAPSGSVSPRRPTAYTARRIRPALVKRPHMDAFASPTGTHERFRKWSAKALWSNSWTERLCPGYSTGQCHGQRIFAMTPIRSSSRSAGASGSFC